MQIVKSWNRELKRVREREIFYYFSDQDYFCLANSFIGISYQLHFWETAHLPLP